MPRAARTEVLAAAERAYALVQAEPRRALVLAEAAVAQARNERQAEGLAAALHVLGFARFRLGDPRALRTMRSAVSVAERHGFSHRAALSRRNLALYLAYRGQLRKAVGEIDAAIEGLSGLDRARSQVFRIAVYGLAGRAREALDDSAAALRVLRSHGDREWEARLAYNRGATLAELGEHTLARRDLEHAHDLYVSLGLRAAAADTKRELAIIAGLQGDLIGSLEDLEAIDVEVLTERDAGWLYFSRAETLLALRLLPEARAELKRFMEASRAQRAVDSLNKSQLDAARLTLAAGDAIAARRLALAARRSFNARGQQPFAAAATLIALASSLASGSRVREDVRRVDRAAIELVAAGWTVEALRAHVLLARAASLHGDAADAQRHVEAARGLDRVGTLADRISLSHARAVAWIAAGDRVRGERALKRGLDLLERHRATLGAMELRATTSALGVALAREGLRIAVDRAAAPAALAWSERLRANALRLPSLRPAADAQLRAAQAELRVIERALREADTGSARGGLASRRMQVEAAVRARSRLVRGEHEASREGADVRLASTLLAEKAFVEYVELDGMLIALTLVQGRLRLHRLGPAAYAEDLKWLQFGLRALAQRRRPSEWLESIAVAARALEDRLVEPLTTTIGGRALVLVPTGDLHAVPWATLPGLRGRSIVVAPSLAAWVDIARRRRSRRGHATVIAGPHLRHAVREAHEIATTASAQVLTGREARVEPVMAALSGAALAHVACHGRFRADNPLFSSLELADGPLTALDLQQLKRVPDVFILSSCDLALSHLHPGDEVLGFSAALLAMGTRTIVASVVPVPDAASRLLMLEFHRLLAGGISPAVALARAQENAPVAGFVCLGSG